MKIVEDLQALQSRTLKYFDLSKTDLQKQYGPGKWNNRQILCHLADAETVLYDRIRRIISEPRQVIWAFNQDKWCDALDYQTFPLEIIRELYKFTRDGAIYLATQHYHSLGEKEFVHSETGVRSLKEEFEKIAWHNAHHLLQIEKALEG